MIKGTIELSDDWGDPGVWDEFVESHEQGRFSHLWTYGAVVECYGYKSRNICFTKGERLVGILPAVEAQSFLFGRRMISQPFSEYGGLLLSPSLTDDEILAIFRLLKSFLLANRRYGTIEIHGNHGVPLRLREPAFQAKNAHRIAYLPTARSPNEIWQKVIQYEARKAVNKARKSGISIIDVCDASTIERLFYPMYLQSSKRLGVPPHKVEYYLNCHRAFGARMKILWAVLGSTRIAALLGFACGKRVSIVNTVSDPAYWTLRPNDLLHWDFIRRTAEDGYDFFDFGSVRYGGQEHFKKKWGCEIDEHKHYFLSGTETLAAARTFDTSGALMSFFSRIWATCVPPVVSSYCGPFVRKHLMR